MRRHIQKSTYDISVSEFQLNAVFATHKNPRKTGLFATAPRMTRLDWPSSGHHRAWPGGSHGATCRLAI
jgi:hypothetical protein